MMWGISSEIGELTVRPARADEGQLFLDILEEAEQWLHERGNRQWVPGAHRPFITTIEQWVREGSLFFGEHYQQIVATSVLKSKPSPFWKGRDRPAMYLSKLTSRRHLAGHRLGEAMLRWSERFSAQSGAEVVRLDCWADNARLCDFYIRMGYTDAGDHNGYGGYRLKLYEKTVQ